MYINDIPWFNVFKEYIPLREAMYNDYNIILLNSIGLTMSGIFFFVIGFLCLFLGGRFTPKEARRQRLVITYALGVSMIICGIGRFFNAYSIWHHYAILTGYLSLLTGTSLFVALTYIPYTMKMINKQRTIDDVSKTLEETKQSVQELKNLTERM